MRILVITQYFWPESFRINDLVLGLQERGNEVIILTGIPNYPSGKFSKGYSFFSPLIETWEGIKIYRSPLLARGNASGFKLLLNYFSFAITASFRVYGIKEKPDRIFVYEPSPVTVGLPAIIAKLRFKKPIYFWVQDIWPHSLTSAGGVSNPTVIALVNSLTIWIYSHCKKVLIQSEGFRRIIAEQKVKQGDIIYFPNWTEEYYVPMAPAEKYKHYFTGKYNLLFAGNIGESQDFKTLVESAFLLRDQLPELHWIIVGDGRMKHEFIDKVRLMGLGDSFKFIGTFPSEEMPLFFSHASALLVSLKNDPVFAITIPSKVQSYLACGRPVLTSLDGEGSRIIEESGAGITTPASCPEKLAQKIIEFVAYPEEKRVEMGRAGRDYYEKVFERNILIDKLVQILQ